MDFLTREQLLSLRDRKPHTVDIPGFGKVRLAKMSARDAITIRKLEKRYTDGEPDAQAELFVKLLSSALVDADGRPMFDRDSAEKLIEALSIEEVSTILIEVNRLNGVVVDKGSAAATPLKAS